jgi:phosphate transport system protein
MPHHFIDRLEDLKDRMARMTAQVQQSAEQSVQSVLFADAILARQVCEMDKQIDKEEVEIEKGAIDLLALYQPAAGDLRLIATIIKANSDFERIADCAVNIAQRVLPLARAEHQPASNLRLMANSVLLMLRETIKAFNLTDEVLARQVLRGDDRVDALYDQIVQEMLGRLGAPAPDAGIELSNVMIAKNLERIADHCMNIAEDVIYVHTGQIIRHLHAV